jgi:hypothetical protein
MGVWGDPPNFGRSSNLGGLPGAPAAAARGLHTCSGSCSAASAQPAFAEAPPCRQQRQQPGVALRAVGPAAGSDVPRINVGVFGVMNAGGRRAEGWALGGCGAGALAVSFGILHAL